MPTKTLTPVETPAHDPVIPEETVRTAHAILHAQMQGEPHPITGEPITREQSWAAHELIKLYQTQDRYGPERARELGRKPKASEATRNYDNLTTESLNTKQAVMIGDWKPSA